MPSRSSLKTTPVLAGDSISRRMRTATVGRRRPAPANGWLARLAVRLVLAAERAVLAQLEPVGIVATVLPCDVVAALALLTGQGDLGPDVGRSHGGVPFLLSRMIAVVRSGGR